MEPFDLLRREAELARKTVNLVATDTYSSPHVRLAAASHFSYLYSVGKTCGPKEYKLTLIRELECEIRERMEKLAGYPYVSLGFRSGTQVIRAFLSFLGREKHIHPAAFAGHPSHRVEPFSELPFDGETHKYLPVRAEVAVIGSSAMMFEPNYKDVNAELLIFDASQVMGFVLVGLFRPSADVILSSTHKTLPALQGGVALFRDEALWERFEEYAFHHVREGCKADYMAALLVALEEMERFGREWLERAVEFARGLGRVLAKEVDVFFSERGVTNTHTLLADIPSDPLIRNGIRVSKVRWGREVTRMGTQNLARFSWTGRDVRKLGELMLSALSGENVKEEVEALAVEKNRPNEAYLLPEEPPAVTW